LEILKLILSVAIASLMLCSFAYGGTPPPSSQLGSSGAVQIKQRKDRDNWQRRGDGDWRDRFVRTIGVIAAALPSVRCGTAHSLRLS
jgi:hypothetical protein